MLSGRELTRLATRGIEKASCDRETDMLHFADFS
jgi:hypothetical protein